MNAKSLRIRPYGTLWERPFSPKRESASEGRRISARKSPGTAGIRPSLALPAKKNASLGHERKCLLALSAQLGGVGNRGSIWGAMSLGLWSH
jgi:hypothetical protein